MINRTLPGSGLMIPRLRPVAWFSSMKGFERGSDVRPPQPHFRLVGQLATALDEMDGAFIHPVAFRPRIGRLGRKRGHCVPLARCPPWFPPCLGCRRYTVSPLTSQRSKKYAAKKAIAVIIYRTICILL
jgi:hypothetical protein